MKKFTRTLFYALNIMVATFAREPACSRYDYEERLLERVLRNEMAVDNLLAEIRQTNAEVKAALKVMQEDKINMSGTIQQMEKENKILKDQLMIPTIYFYARSQASSSVPDSQTVVYTVVDINEGGGYDPGTGRFTVSVPGLYSFAVQYCIQTANDVSLEIVNQTKTLQRAFFLDNGNSYPCLSMQVFIKAGVSDQIWVKSTQSSSQLYTDSLRYNSFSGALVHL